MFSEPLLNACGTEAKFCRRQRIITPFRLGRALTATCASQPVETLADFHRGFNALWGTTITYKAFSNQVAKSRFADFARTMTSRLIGDMTLKVLGFAKGRAFAEFRHIVLQDGSSFAIHDGLREVFPGRFKVVKPAAVELHTAMDLLCDTPTTVVLTPDTTNEQAFLPEPASLRASVLLADRGYLDLHYLRHLQDASGFFIIRAKAGMNPQVVEAFREDGKRLRSLRHKPLKAIHAKLPKRQRVDSWWNRWRSIPSASVCSSAGLPDEGVLLPVDQPAGAALSPRHDLSRLQMALASGLLFKEWKSYANLHAFDTENPAIVEGLIWTAIAAAALKRFLAHMTQLLLEVPMSTRKVAMCCTRLRQDCPGLEDRGRGRAL